MSDELLRTCTKCGLTLPIDQFSKSSVSVSSGATLRRFKCVGCRKTSDLVAHKKRNSSIEGWCKRRVRDIKARCIRSGVEFAITCEDLIAAFPVDKLCPALGVSFVMGRRSQHNPSVDRIVPNIGYVRGNIAIISKKANSIKLDASLTELELVVDWLSRVVSDDAKDYIRYVLRFKTKGVSCD